MNELDKQEIIIAPGVAESIVAIAVAQVDGVAYLGSKPAPSKSVIATIFINKPSTPGVVILEEDGKITVEIHAKLYYGYKLQEVAANIRIAIADALLAQACISIDQVNITVDGIIFKV